jgi:hypothetical protein
MSIAIAMKSRRRSVLARSRPGFYTQNQRHLEHLHALDLFTRKSRRRRGKEPVKLGPPGSPRLNLQVLPKRIPLVLLELLEFLKALGQSARGVKMGDSGPALHAKKIVDSSPKSEPRGGLMVQ